MNSQSEDDIELYKHRDRYDKFVNPNIKMF